MLVIREVTEQKGFIHQLYSLRLLIKADDVAIVWVNQMTQADTIGYGAKWL